ncbi:ankyrin repeat-containing domain protein [Hypoxylon cercidicola]|nr:ankyrin repeat-containing domain protein [Hypoxylon cercidicola]
MTLTTAAASLASLMETLTFRVPEAETKKTIISVPAEIVLGICQYLPQVDKFRLAQSSSRLTVPAIAALRDQDAREDNAALFWAVSRNLDRMLGHILTQRPQLVNHHFQEDHLSTRGHYMIRSGKFMTPLTAAIRFRRHESLETLLRFDADANLPDQEPIAGHTGRWSPIHWAVAAVKAGEGFDALLSLLVKHGANLNASPLLPDAGVDGSDSDPLDTFDFKPEELAPLFSQLNFIHPQSTSDEIKRSSATQFHNDLIELINARKSKVMSLLKFGADPNLREENTSCTPIFHIALALRDYKPDFYVKDERIWQNYDVEEQYQDIIIPTAMDYFDLLIQHGGDITISCCGTTALHIICQRLEQYEVLVNYLLKEGISINATDEHGRTPLFGLMARATNDLHALRRFIQKGADVNHKDDEGCTPLHILVKYRGSQERLRKIVLVLLDYGADASIRNNANETATDVAMARRVKLWPEIIDTLRSAEHRATCRKNGVKLGGGRKGGRGSRRGRSSGHHGS